MNNSSQEGIDLPPMGGKLGIHTAQMERPSKTNGISISGFKEKVFSRETDVCWAMDL
jgi:hypothetical protein